MKYLLLILSLSLFSLTAFAEIKVVTTLPDIAEVVRDIGGHQVSVDSLLRGTEDAHYAEARPDYILKVNRADIVCSMGLDLEIGWLPKVVSKAGNSKISNEQCVLGKSITAREIPTGVINRALGDVHPHGNPHFALDPLKLVEGSNEVVRALSEKAPESKDLFVKNQEAFKKRMTTLHSDIQKKIKPIKVMEYHKEFSYFFASYGIESLGSLEEKPGMPPSAARIAQVAKLAKEKGVKVVLATPSAPHKVLEKFTELSGVPVKIVPSYVQKSGQGSSIAELQNMLAEALQ